VLQFKRRQVPDQIADEGGHLGFARA